MKKRKRKGISLIVLVITIIVVIILAAAIILTLNKNNPIEDANRARYESDRDNMQSIFTNTVAKIMAENQGSIIIKPGKLNEITGEENKTIGVVKYEIENGADISKAKGTIVFDNKENTDIEYYTGKKLPIYRAGETKWYVDSQGILMLEVGEQIYGEGKKEIDTEEGEKTQISKEEFDKLKESIEQIKETVNELKTTKLKIDGARSGEIEIGKVGANTSKTIKVTFSDQMVDNNYAVVVTQGRAVRHYQLTKISIETKREDGFLIRAYNTANEVTDDLIVNYIAIPYTK